MTIQRPRRRARCGGATTSASWRLATRIAATIAFALTFLGPTPREVHAESARPARPPLIHLTRFDAWYGLATVAAVGGIGRADDWFRERAAASDGAPTRRLAHTVRPFGSVVVVGPALLLGYLGGRVLDRPGLATTSARVAASVVISAATAEGLKLAIGRVRPNEIAEETDHFQPFSGHDSFPSGHATVAFATATALDRETTTRWVPWVAYPLAGLVGWSRVHDDLHWTSDIVAGAALGCWIARKTEDAIHVRAERRGGVGILLESQGGPMRLGARLAF